MTRTLRVTSERWPLARPFTISRGTKIEAEVVTVEVAERERGGRIMVGRGEAVPYPRYGENTAAVIAQLQALEGAVAAGLNRDGLASRLPAGAARNALDCALWDLEAKIAGRPVWELAGLPVPLPVMTAQTVALDEPEAMAAAAGCLRECPLLKIKVGRDRVLDRVAAVHAAAPAARVIVDANEAWDVTLLRKLWDGLAAQGVAVIEQPLPVASDAELPHGGGPVPVFADESCHDVTDLDRLGERYQGINVKLDKAGGLTGAMALIQQARARGLRIMVGCMVSTSLAIAPALLLTPLAEVVDLDGPLWLTRDRAPGLRIHAGQIDPPTPDLWG